MLTAYIQNQHISLTAYGPLLSHQGYPSENPEADNAVQVFRMPEPVHSQVLPSTSEVALYFDF